MKMFPNIAEQFITTKLFTYDDINIYNFFYYCSLYSLQNI